MATIQLWPEHFDAATTVTLPSMEPVDLGFSPGDGFESEPYLSVGPWGAARPGDPRFWNVPFGSMRRHSDVNSATHPPTSVVSSWRTAFVGRHRRRERLGTAACREGRDRLWLLGPDERGPGQDEDPHGHKHQAQNLDDRRHTPGVHVLTEEPQADGDCHQWLHDGQRRQ